MGYEVVKQPDGKLAVLSTESDSIVCWDCRPDELVEWFALRARDAARKQAQRVVDFVVNDEPQRAYHQFAHTWEEVLELDREHGGVYTTLLDQRRDG